MNLSFVSIITTDGLKLPGLLYEPKHQTKKVAIWLHGMGDNGVFYNPKRINILGKSLNEKGVALLAFNNRGAHGSKRLSYVDRELDKYSKGYQGGTYYEKIIDCKKDIDGCHAFLDNKGYSQFYLVGHSTGANKICVYDYNSSYNPFSKYVLAGPGDDSGLFYTTLGSKVFKTALNYANKAIKENRPLKIMPKTSGMYPFSAQSTKDILNPDGNYNTFPFFEFTSKRLGQKPLFKEFTNIKLPMLVIYGAEDEYSQTAGDSKSALQILKQVKAKSSNNKLDIALIKYADHGFHDHETEFAQIISDYLIS